MTTPQFKSSFHIGGTRWLAIISAIMILFSCNKNAETFVMMKKPPRYEADVLDKWMTMQLRLMRNATGIANHAFSRHFAYSGIAAMQSLDTRFNSQPEWSGMWNGLTGLPSPDHSKDYYHPASVNAALAAINRSMFPNANIADKAAIDSLEAALQQSFLATEPAATITLSSNFGKAVAAAVFSWSETDGYKNANNPYTPPTGPGLWKPTPAAYANAATPYWGANRPVIQYSTANSQPQSLFVYSEEEGSDFFQMVKQVYDASLTLTSEQKAMAMFWRDVPGATSPGHWLSILQQVIRQKHTQLHEAVLAYALTGAAINDALISCFTAKYTFNVIRPISYIRDVMGHATWSSFLGTPATPEYSSAHSALSSAAAEMLERLFGNIGSFTDHTYDYLGFAPRTYTSFTSIGVEAGQSRFYAGIHYLPSIDAGIWQGRKVVENIFTKHIEDRVSR